jgi:hypothetical protein
VNENLRVSSLGTESIVYSDVYWDQTDSAIKDERTFDELVERTRWLSYLRAVEMSKYQVHTGESTAFTFSFGEMPVV